MDAPRVHLIWHKLANLSAYVDELSPYLEVPYQEYRGRPGNRRIVERLAQVIIECAIDVNGMLLVDAGHPPAQSARQAFEIVQELGVIDAQLLSRFQGYVGMRNRIVHDYDRLDARVLFYSARRLLDDARAYITQVQSYLAANQGSGRSSTS